LKEKVRILSANLENTTNTLKYSETLYDQAKIEKKEWEVKLVESLARFDKWKTSSKNLAKLINSSMTTRTKLGLGFKEYFGSDEVFDLSTPSIFNPEPITREVKSLYERFVKPGDTHEVPPSITGTFMPTSSHYVLEETQVTFGSKSPTSINTFDYNDFVSCDNSDKSSESETHDFASCVSSPMPADSFSTVDVQILPKSDVKDPSPTNEFQLPDDSQVVLCIPRRHDIYTFNLSDIQPEQHINCLLEKASLEESTKWHRRMAHVNFKTINKLAKLGFVEGLPLKLFTNDHNCVAWKANDGFLVGYAAHNKAYRVYNLSSKKVEEMLNLRYLEDKPNVQGLDQEWYFDLDYLTDSLGYTRFKTNPPAGPDDTSILAGTQANDSDSECDEHVILVPSFPSNSFSGPTVQDVSAPMENNLDYAEELAQIQRQEYEAHYATAKHGFEFSVDTAALFPQANIEIRRNLVPAAGDPAGGLVPTGGDLAGNTVPASNVPAGNFPTRCVPAGGVLTGSLVSSDSGASSVPAASVLVPAIVSTDSAATSSLLPIHSLGSCAHTT
nr:ribonuclease H-like domain-containing protein [Tanacetum cinerariifolium]